MLFRKLHCIHHHCLIIYSTVLFPQISLFFLIVPISIFFCFSHCINKYLCFVQYKFIISTIQNIYFDTGIIQQYISIICTWCANVYFQIFGVLKAKNPKLLCQRSKKNCKVKLSL